MTWFEELTGCSENSPEQVREQLTLKRELLYSRVNHKSWQHGWLETPNLAELRQRVRDSAYKAGQVAVREVVANVQLLHEEATNANSLFQVASQFNLLEMASPGVTPECGVGIYEDDYTQGPACAIAAGAGTIFRNYFVNTNGQVGQTKDNQIDCLADIAALLGNAEQSLWEMVNGYALASADGLEEINRQLEEMDGDALDRVRQSLRIGTLWETRVTLGDSSHHVSQAYCSAMPVSYTRHAMALWAPFATLILEGAYEATICAAILNRVRNGSDKLFLTLLGGGAFGNSPDWIMGAIRRSIDLYPDSGLDIAIVSFGSSSQSVEQLVRDFT